jgi:hypothetical protein
MNYSLSVRHTGTDSATVSNSENSLTANLYMTF